MKVPFATPARARDCIVEVPMRSYEITRNISPNPSITLSSRGRTASGAEQRADGTQCYVQFDAVADAKGYDVWAAPYEDGTGGLLLGKASTRPGKLIRGLLPDTDFYLFLTYTDVDGKVSKPSGPFKVHLKDIFGMK